MVSFAAMARGSWLGTVLLVVGVAFLGYAAAPLAFPRPVESRSPYFDLALRTQAYTWGQLAFTAGAPDCESAPYLTYRRDQINASIADHWYVALQVRADAALVRAGDARFRCHVEKALPWMEWLWSPTHAGYAPRADLDGANPTLQDVYADDNAVIGLAFLDIARLTDDPQLRARALHGAVRAARYPIAAGLWDGDLTGGLWWTNQRDQLGEGKPAQSTALLAHVMAELYAETGDPVYRQHAIDSLAWLDRMVWSDYHDLYAYDVRYVRRNPDKIVRTQRYFGYDQAIAIQALLVLYRLEPENTAYLARAQQLARATDRWFWQAELGGYTLEADVPDQYASYSVWISEAFIDLYHTDGNRYWLERARANFDHLEARFRHGDSGAYYHRLFPCRDAFARFCASGQDYGLDRTVYTLSQAMMQRVAALLAATP